MYSALSAAVSTGGAASVAQCALCPAGKWQPSYAVQVLSQCRLCQKGKFSAAGASFCSNCATGRYADQAGLAVCKGCSAGRWGRYSGRTTYNQCPTCPLGRFASTAAARTSYNQ